MSRFGGSDRYVNWKWHLCGLFVYAYATKQI